MKYENHPICVIEIEKTGRIVFSPKGEEKVPDDFSKLAMPARDFWEGVSTLLNDMNDEISRLKRTAAIQQSVIMQLSNEVETLNNSGNRKIVFVNNNKKQAFFAGLSLGKRNGKQ